MDNALLKVGVVGCGFMTQNARIPLGLRCRDIRLIGICDKNEELAGNLKGNSKSEEELTKYGIAIIAWKGEENGDG